MSTPTFYQFAIGNLARHLRSKENLAKVNLSDTSEPGMNAFAASEVLAIVFCKNKEEIMQDIVGSSVAMDMANLLNTFPNDTMGKNIQSFPFYNGRENGICLIVGKNAISDKVLAINFGRNRNSDNLFVLVKEIERPGNCPTVESKIFDETAYKGRKYFEHTEMYESVEYIYKFIIGYGCL